ncbi:condensation domain-containing protein, partial [Tenacibaculum halocynthiae]|uniref:condensation domain-containing protein n=1 Tax=Tenacibaculum halocynthiae TaxID=1254437 RepID=UPI0038B43CB0
VIEEKLVGIYSEILGVDSDIIGVNSKFFDLGGNSLSFVFLKNRLKEEFNISLTLSKLMSIEDIQGLALMINKSDQEEFFKIPEAVELDYYPLSSTQKRMYFLHEYDRNSVVYNIPMVVTLSGVLDIEKLKFAFQKLIERHDSLRTVFEFIKGKPVQRILPEVNFSIKNFNIDTDIDLAIDSFIRPFNLSEGPLLRVGVASISAQESLMIIDTHHIISDGVTSTILLEDLKSLYKEEILPNLSIQYKDYVMWQLEKKQQEEIKSHEEFWLKVFSKKVPTLELPYDYNRPKEQSSEGGNYLIELNNDQHKQLKKLSSSLGVTMYSLILSIYNVLLSKLTNQNDIVVGTPLAGRQHVDLESIAGVFINTLALRNYPDGDITFKSFLKQVQEGVSLALDNQLYPYEELVDVLNLERDTSRNALFDVFLNYELEDKKREFTDSELKIDKFKKLYSVAKFDLQLMALDSEESLELVFTYSKDLFKASSVELFGSYFVNIIDEVLKDENQLLKDIKIVSEKESEKLLIEHSNTDVSYQKDKTIIDLFKEQVSLKEDTAAVVFEQESLSYKE